MPAPNLYKGFRAETNATLSTAKTLLFPAGTIVGDRVVILMAMKNNGDVNPTVPAGWSLSDRRQNNVRLVYIRKQLTVGDSLADVAITLPVSVGVRYCVWTFGIGVKIAVANSSNGSSSAWQHFPQGSPGGFQMTLSAVAYATNRTISSYPYLDNRNAESAGTLLGLAHCESTTEQTTRYQDPYSASGSSDYVTYRLYIQFPYSQDVGVNNLHLNDGGAWKLPKSISIRDAGVWKLAREVHVRQAGAWEKVYGYAPLGYINLQFVQADQSPATGLSSYATPIAPALPALAAGDRRYAVVSCMMTRGDNQTINLSSLQINGQAITAGNRFGSDANGVAAYIGYLELTGAAATSTVAAQVNTGNNMDHPALGIYYIDTGPGGIASVRGGTLYTDQFALPGGQGINWLNIDLTDPAAGPLITLSANRGDYGNALNTQLTDTKSSEDFFRDGSTSGSDSNYQAFSTKGNDTSECRWAHTWSATTVQRTRLSAMQFVVA